MNYHEVTKATLLYLLLTANVNWTYKRNANASFINKSTAKQASHFKISLDRSDLYIILMDWKTVLKILSVHSFPLPGVPTTLVP